MGGRSLSPSAMVLVSVPKTSSQVPSKVRLTPMAKAMALTVALGVDSYNATTSHLNCFVQVLRGMVEIYLTAPAECWCQCVHHQEADLIAQRATTVQGLDYAD